ncbi:LysR family transcriptional regulator [Rhodovastum atsumiense]|uniref:LysR family transcriptional regulator n=1 Tax=Rhodovastum atsumiense TaxID=504468 RepID=A0A5M6IKK2_9PROT|nr:LysR family transcriptional regulator [Rhodovastum atsumiense]KAA5608784.1 LysR family transcriptional regulator [Rhodovastum atsumiense]CAH2602863.1 LysR family transcriptional regulator [Rhodovastum atsumiense]
MSLRALRTLIAIARHGTFARAGEAIGLTQSAVSLHVKALEEEFGTRLFDRSRRQPVLTEPGRKLVAQAEDLLGLYDRIPEALSDDGALTGRLRLGAIQTALAGPLPDALVALRRAHPRLRVHVSSGMSAELARLVVGGELDAAITTEPVRPHPAELTWTPLYEDQFWVLAPPEQQGRALPQMLAELPFIQFDPQTWAGRMIARELRRQGLQVQQGMSLDNREVILRMVAGGLGVAVVPIPAEMVPELPPLCRLPFGRPQLRRRVVLLQRRERPARRLATAVGEAVARTMRKT